MEVLGSLHYFLGIEAQWTSDVMCLTQSKYIHDTLDDYAILDCKPVSPPVVLGSRLLLENCDLLPDPTLY